MSFKIQKSNSFITLINLVSVCKNNFYKVVKQTEDLYWANNKTSFDFIKFKVFLIRAKAAFSYYKKTDDFRLIKQLFWAESRQRRSVASFHPSVTF